MTTKCENIDLELSWLCCFISFPGFLFFSIFLFFVQQNIESEGVQLSAFRPVNRIRHILGPCRRPGSTSPVWCRTLSSLNNLCPSRSPAKTEQIGFLIKIMMTIFPTTSPGNYSMHSQGEYTHRLIVIESQGLKALVDLSTMQINEGLQLPFFLASFLGNY